MERYQLSVSSFLFCRLMDHQLYDICNELFLPIVVVVLVVSNWLHSFGYLFLGIILVFVG